MELNNSLNSCRVEQVEPATQQIIDKINVELKIAGAGFQLKPKDIQIINGKIVGLDMMVGTNFEVPHSISQLQDLKCLNLSSNFFQQIPSVIKDLSKLKELYLSHVFTEKEGELPRWMRHLKQLEVLHLNYNRLKFIPDWIADLPLKELKLRFVNITEIPQSFIKLTKLTKLKISLTAMTKVVDTRYEELRQEFYKNNPEYYQMIDREELFIDYLQHKELDDILPLGTIPRWLYDLNEQNCFIEYFDQINFIHLT